MLKRNFFNIRHLSKSSQQFNILPQPAFVWSRDIGVAFNSSTSDESRITNSSRAPRASSVQPRQRRSHQFKNSKVYPLTQFSIFKLATRLNSFVLFVTRTAPILWACAAIYISNEPIGLPSFSNLERILPYSIAAEASKSRMCNGSRN